VVTSSGLGCRPVAGTLAYSATKSSASFFAQALSYEVEDKIDVMDWQAGETATKMLRKQPGGRVLSTADAVKGMLSDLGRERSTFGAPRHDLLTGAFSRVPDFLLQPFMFDVLKKTYRL